MKTIKVNVHLLAVISMTLWGFSYVWTKIVFKYYEPLTTIFIRLTLSSLFLILFIFLFRKSETIKKRHWKLFLLSALFNPFLYFVGESYGLDRVSATIGSVIIGTIPLFTPLAAYFALKEKLSKINIFGLGVSFIGILIMLMKKDFSLAADPIGLSFLFLAVAAAVIYGILLKKLTIHYSSITIIAYQNGIGAIYFLPFFLLFEFNDFVKITPNMELIISLISLAIFASSLAYIFYTSVVKEIGISKGNMYTNLIPVCTGITSYFVLEEQFAFAKIIGIFVVILGVIFSQLKKLSFNNKL